MKSSFARAAVLLLCAAAFAVAAEKDPWIRISSPHFDLFTSAGERTARGLLNHFEQVHSFFLQRFSTGIDPARKARVILFHSDKEYAPYRPNEFASAFYQPGEDRDVIVMNSAVENVRTVAVHELTHLMIRHIGLKLPAWLDEGLAELYSNVEPHGAQIMVGRDIPGRMHALATERWIDLRTLLAVDHQSRIYNEKSRAGIFYAESWKLVHMLSLHPQYAPGFPQLVAAINKGTPEAAFQAVYGKDLDAVQRDAQAYLSGGTISAALFDIPMAKATDAPTVAAGMALQARLALAEMLSNMRGRAGQAQADYDALARDYPSRWEVAEAQGRFAWRRRDLDAAARHFRRAEELGCRDGAMLLLWGRALVYARKTADAVAVLSKAAKLLHESDEAQLEYGNALALNGSWASAVGVLRTVKKVPPESLWRYHYNIAYGLYRSGDVTGAKESSTQARQFAGSDRENASLDQLDAALNHPARRNTAPEPALPAVEGTLEKMECSQINRLHVRVDGEIRIFAMPNPAEIRVTGENSARIDLDCGPQAAPRKLRIEYQDAPGTSGIAGVVRVLQFQ